MKKNDFILIIIIALVGIVLFFLINVMLSKPGSAIKVYIDGELTRELSLSEDGNYDIISGDDGINILVIENGAAYIKDANCPDKICVNEGKISQGGESLICLPHKLVVSVDITQENEKEIDAVVR